MVCKNKDDEKEMFIVLPCTKMRKNRRSELRRGWKRKVMELFSDNCYLYFLCCVIKNCTIKQWTECYRYNKIYLQTIEGMFYAVVSRGHPIVVFQRE